MRLFKTKWAALSIGLLLLAACSRGGGGTPESTMTITHTNQAGAATTFQAVAANSAMQGAADIVDNKTVIQMCGDVDQDNDCSQFITLTIDGTAAGKYSIDSADSPSQIVYNDELNHYVSTSGVINVSGNSGAGGVVSGDFQATLDCNSGCTGTTDIKGTFTVLLSK